MEIFTHTRDGPNVDCLIKGRSGIRRFPTRFSSAFLYNHRRVVGLIAKGVCGLRFPRTGAPHKRGSLVPVFRQLHASQTKMLENRTRGSGVGCRGTLRSFVDPIEYSHPRKFPRKHTPDSRVRVSSIFVWEACISKPWIPVQICHARQTTSWDNEIADRACFSRYLHGLPHEVCGNRNRQSACRVEALCDGSSTKSSTHTIASVFDAIKREIVMSYDSLSHLFQLSKRFNSVSLYSINRS